MEFKMIHMKKINILYYEPTSGYGGSSRCLLGWIKKLNREKFDTIVTVHYDGPAIQKIRKSEVRVIDIPFKSFYVYRSLAQNGIFAISYLLSVLDFLFFCIPTSILLFFIIKKYGVNIIHLNAKLIGVIPGILAAKFTGILCVCHLHDIKIPLKKEKFFAKGVDCFIVLTKKAFDLYKKVFTNKRIELIPNGIDLEEYKNINNFHNLRSEFNVKEEEIIVGMVGRLVEGKGFPDFIKAAKIICNKYVKVKFFIVGSATNEDKKYEDYLKKFVKESNLERDVIFTGWREDAKRIMSVLDIIVHASSTFPEGFPLTILEAMALGKPLVVTDVPGSSEIVINGKTAYVVPPANPEELAKALEKLIDNRELSLKIGEMGREAAERNYSLNISVNKIEYLYQSLLKQRIDGEGESWSVYESKA